MPKGKNPNHTSCRPGTTVIVKPIEGRPIIDTFVKRKGNWIFLKNYGKIGKDEIRQFAVYKKR